MEALDLSTRPSGAFACGIHARLGTSYRSYHFPESESLDIAPIMQGYEIPVRLLCKAAYLPKRATEKSAGLDLFAPHPATLPSYARMCIPLGIAMCPPEGTYIRLASRSGLALKGIDVSGGVIDQDYRGEVCAILDNQTAAEYQIRPGHAIAQAIVTPYEHLKPIQVEFLPPTCRGISGFGSSSVTYTAPPLPPRPGFNK